MKGRTLIIQDDAVLATIPDDFSHDQSLIALYHPGLPGRGMNEYLKAERKGHDMAVLSGSPFVSTVALTWPQPLAKRFIEWCDYQPHVPVEDDVLVGRWVREERISLLATIPSLVNHDPGSPSLTDPRQATVPTAWRQALRPA